MRRPIVSNFAETIKIATIFNKATFKDSEKCKRIGIKCNLYLYFLTQQKLPISD